MSGYAGYFIVAGALIFGIGLAKLYNTKSRVKKAKKVYYTYGELYVKDLREWFARFKSDIKGRLKHG